MLTRYRYLYIADLLVRGLFTSVFMIVIMGCLVVGAGIEWLRPLFMLAENPPMFFLVACILWLWVGVLVSKEEK